MFCEKCGAKLEVAEEKKESPKAQQQPVKTSKPMTKQNKIIIAAVSAVALIMVAGGAFYLVKTKKERA